MPRRAPQATIAKYLIAFKWPALQVSNGLKVLVIGQNVMLKGSRRARNQLSIFSCVAWRGQPSGRNLALMQAHDDDLQIFEAEGAAPLPPTNSQGQVEHDGALIWYASYGFGFPVILLHGGLGHSGNWGYQLPAVIASGYRAVLVDSRGHGRSTRDSRPFTYELMASDVLAVMDALRLEKATVVGWSDGACTALILATNVPARVAGVFFFACNMDPSGLKEIAQPNPLLDRCFRRHAKDYAAAVCYSGRIQSIYRSDRSDAEDAAQLFCAAVG